MTIFYAMGQAGARTADRADAHEFPPMQKGATFNLEALKAELEKKMEALKSQQGQ